MRNLSIALLCFAAMIVEWYTWKPYGDLVRKAEGITTSIPSDFPADAPIPPDAKCARARKSRHVFRVDLTVNQPVLPVVRFFEGQLVSQGWQLEPVSLHDVVFARKEGRRFAAFLSPLNSGSSEVHLTVR